MALFYDNQVQSDTSEVDFQMVERVYAIRFSNFTEAHWKRLDVTYQSLPEFVDYGNCDIPFWFGTEDSPLFLSASVEPSGLLVHGRLSAEQWLAWDTKFREHLPEFPTFEV